ncbi:MAG: hypothetical protein ACRETM_04585 [Stenotrophobium sp.]
MNVRPAYARLTLVLLWIAAIGIVLYWTCYFTGGEVQASGADCYRAFERNFPLPDGFVALCAVLCALSLRRGDERCLLWGLLTAGGFFFLGFIDIAYNLWNGMYEIFSAAMAAEIVINLFSLGFALWLSVFFWRNRRSWLR